MSYGEILKKSFYLAWVHPFLWLYGFFMVGTFNINFLYIQGWSWEEYLTPENFQKIMVFLQVHTGWLLIATVGILILSFLGLMATNWARILLVLSTKNILDNKPLIRKELLVSGKKVQWQVIGVSLTTTALLIIAALVLLAPPLVLKYSQREVVLWFTSSITFLPLSFALSLINIFGSFNAILYGTSLGKSLNLGTDFFIANWSKVLGMLIVMGIIYMGLFGIGAAFSYLLNASVTLTVSSFGQFGFFGLSAIMYLVKSAILLIFWIFLAFLNVVFNTVLLLLFFELSKPLKPGELREKEIVASPAVP